MGITTPGSDDSTEKLIGDQLLPPGVALGPEPNFSAAKLARQQFAQALIRYLRTF